MASVPLVCCLVLLSNLHVLVVQAQYEGPPLYPYGPSPYPIIIKDSDSDGMRNIWPILLLLLADNWGNGGGGGGGCGRGCGCGCCCGCGCGGGCSNNNIPIPYPIAIPVNCPIIT